MRGNCIVVVMERRMAFFDIGADDFCFTAYGNRITRTIF